MWKFAFQVCDIILALLNAYKPDTYFFLVNFKS